MDKTYTLKDLKDICSDIDTSKFTFAVNFFKNNRTIYYATGFQIDEEHKRINFLSKIQFEFIDEFFKAFSTDKYDDFELFCFDGNINDIFVEEDAWTYDATHEPIVHLNHLS